MAVGVCTNSEPFLGLRARVPPRAGGMLSDPVLPERSEAEAAVDRRVWLDQHKSFQVVSFTERGRASPKHGEHQGYASKSLCQSFKTVVHRRST